MESADPQRGECRGPADGPAPVRNRSRRRLQRASLLQEMSRAEQIARAPTGADVSCFLDTRVRWNGPRRTGSRPASGPQLLRLDRLLHLLERLVGLAAGALERSVLA